MVRVIFLENIEDHKVGDVREVADGYARNFLFKKGIAKVATQTEVEEVEAKIEKLKKEEAQKVSEVQKIAEKLTSEKILLNEEVNEEGHLYGAVSNREVAEKLNELGYEIESANVEIEEPMKELGEYPVRVKLGHGVETEIKVKIDRK